MIIYFLYAVTMILAVSLVLRGGLDNSPVERRVNRAFKNAVRNGLQLGVAARQRRFSRHDILQACDAGSSRAVSSPALA